MKKTFKVILVVLLVIILAAIGAIWYFMDRLTEDAVPIVAVENPNWRKWPRPRKLRWTW